MHVAMKSFIARNTSVSFERKTPPTPVEHLQFYARLDCHKPLRILRWGSVRVPSVCYYVAFYIHPVKPGDTP